MANVTLSTPPYPIVAPFVSLKRGRPTEVESVEVVAESTLQSSKADRPPAKKQAKLLKEEKLSEIPRPFDPSKRPYIKIPSLQWTESNHLHYLNKKLMERVERDFPQLKELPLMDLLSVGIPQNFRPNISMKDIYRAWYEDHTPPHLDFDTFYQAILQLKPIFSNIIFEKKDARRFNEQTDVVRLSLDSFKLKDPRFIRIKKIAQISKENLELLQTEAVKKLNQLPNLKQIKPSLVWDLATVSVSETFGNKVTNAQFAGAYFKKLLEVSDLQEGQLDRLSEQLNTLKRFILDFADRRRHFPRYMN